MKAGAIIIVVFFIVLIITIIYVNIADKFESKKNHYNKSISYKHKKIEPKPEEKIIAEPKEPIKHEEIKKYQIKPRFISNCEIDYFFTIKSIIKDKYVIFPQVPLSQIVEKTTDKRYINELFRTIDFCIFNFQMKPLVCIEINDNTHHQVERYIRDKKVKDILNEASLPLITLWTEYGIKPEYIEKRLQAYINI